MAVLGRGWTKSRNNGGIQAGQHRSVYSPANLGPRLDQDKKKIMAKDRPANMNRYIGRQSLATVAPRSDILAGDRPANIDQYVGRQFWATVGPRSKVLAKERPAT